MANSDSDSDSDSDFITFADRAAHYAGIRSPAPLFRQRRRQFAAEREDRVLPLWEQLLAARTQRAADPAWQQYAAVADAERAARVQEESQSAQPAPAPKPQPVPDLAEGVNCIICMDSLVKEDWRVVVPCGHTFHTKCIEVSRRYDNRCPECRRDIRDLVRVYWGGKRKNKKSMPLRNGLLARAWCFQCSARSTYFGIWRSVAPPIPRRFSPG